MRGAKQAGRTWRVTGPGVAAQAAAAALAALLLTAADEPAPSVELPPPSARTFTLKGNGLTIDLGPDTTYLRFTGGVTVSGTDFELSAQNVEIDLKSGEVLSGEQIKLPKVPVSDERIAQEPGQAVAEMARELKLPAANLSPSAIARVSASGAVSVQAKGAKLGAAKLLSTDGGRSWSANGRATITSSNKDESYELSADSLLYDTQGKRAIAQGNIAGRFTKQGDKALEVAAEHCEMDLEQRRLAVGGALSVRYGSISLSCSDLTADIGQRVLTSGGAPQLADSASGVSLSSQALTVDLAKRVATAQGGVVMVDAERDLRLEAGRITADLQEHVYVANEQPRVTYHDSSYSGEKITVRQKDDKTTIEVDGPQQVRINVDDLPKTK